MDGVSSIIGLLDGHSVLWRGLASYGAAAIAYPLYRFTLGLNQSKKKVKNAQIIASATAAAGLVNQDVGTQIDIAHYLETFKALQESEQRYRHLYQETPAMLHSVDRQGRIVSVSHYWLEKLGYDRSEVIGEPLSRFVAEDSRQKIEDILLKLKANVVCREQLCYFLKKNGDRMDTLLSTISDCDGEICSGNSLSVLVDVTERNRAKEKLRRSETLLRAINNLPPTGIFVMDCHSNEALFINSEFYRIWQLEHLQSAVTQGHMSGEQLLTECLSNIDLGAFVTTSTAQDFTDGNRIIEDEVPLLDGRTLRRIYGPIQEDNSTFAYLYVFEDITERKQAVQKLANATTAAEAANRAKSEFLANMSHELRSPLNAILGFTHLLKTSQLTAEQQENLAIIYRSGEHLLALINDILDISKIEAGQVTITDSEFDLYRLLDELQQMFYPSICEKGLKLIVSRSPNLPRIVCSDRLKLRQILINLLSNAVKFTATGTITLSAEATASTSAQTPSQTPSQTLANQLASPQALTFAVTDTGSGIAPADQQRLFEAFVQADSGLTAHEGTGLGLAISSEYVQLLGGELTVKSALGKGSTFSFSLLAAAMSAELSALQSAQSGSNLAPDQAPDWAPNLGHVIGLAPHQPTYKILVVDDVAINRKLLTHLLISVGFEVKEATNGKEAIAQWQAWQPDLIWMDMRMPVMTGEEATQRLKALDTAGKTRIIALSASAFKDNQARAIASGCDAFVSKPIQPAEIFKTMSQHLGVRYLYEPLNSTSAAPTAAISPELIAPTPPSWQQALTQATLELDDSAILDLASQLGPEHSALIQTLEKCVKNLAYKQILQALQVVELGAHLSAFSR